MINFQQLLGNNPTDERLELVIRLMRQQYLAEEAERRDLVRLTELHLLRNVHISAGAQQGNLSTGYIDACHRDQDFRFPTPPLLQPSQANFDTITSNARQNGESALQFYNPASDPAVTLVSEQLEHLTFANALSQRCSIPLPLQLQSELSFDSLSCAGQGSLGYEDLLTKEPSLHMQESNLPMAPPESAQHLTDECQALDLNFISSGFDKSMLDVLCQSASPVDDFNFNGPATDNSPDVFNGTPTAIPTVLQLINNDTSENPVHLSSARALRTEERRLATVATRKIVPSADRPTNCRAMQIEVWCRTCSKDLGRAHLYTDMNHAGTYVHEFSCKECAHGAVWNDSQLQRKIFKKRQYAEVEPQDAPVRCHVCKTACAAGGFRHSAEEGWKAPDFAIEFNCSPCLKKYSLCTSCGAGGKFRAGKWRPKELFAEGRATCSLSHIRRVGIRTTEFAWHVPHNHLPFTRTYPPLDDAPVPVQAILRAIHKCTVNICARQAATPAFLESNEKIKNWSTFAEIIEKFVRHAQKELEGHGTKVNALHAQHSTSIGKESTVRTYVALNTVVSTSKSGTCSDWRDITPDTLDVSLPELTGVAIADWDVARGYVYLTFGCDNITKNSTERSPTESILTRVIEDHAAMAIKAAAPDSEFTCPPCPVFYHVAIGLRRKFDEGQWQRLGYRVIEKKDDGTGLWHYKSGRANLDADEVLKHIVEFNETDHGLPEFTHLLGKINDILAASGAEVGADQGGEKEGAAGLTFPRKRGWKS
ncbi:hypothetical protein HDU88_007852 [Geranomyces variabilis]|nr:hypothetical protein HDU88_007852 [Geranomyces variabilis]